MTAILLRVGVSAGTLLALLWLVPWHELLASASRLPPLVWLGTLAGFLAGHLLGTAKWRRLLNVGGAGLKATDAIRCYAAGLFANLCLPSIVGGDVLRAALAGRATRRPEAVVLAGVADRVIDVAALAMLAAAGGLLAPRVIPGWGGEVLRVATMLTLAVLPPALFLGLRRPLARWPRRVRRPLGRALVALRRTARTPRASLLALGSALLIQGTFVLLNAWIGRSIGVDVPFAVWLLAWPLAKVAGLLPISLGGLGVRDATFAALLVPVGVPAALGVVTSLLWQSVLIAGGLVGGLTWLLLSRRARVQPGFASRGALAAVGPRADA